MRRLIFVFVLAQLGALWGAGRDPFAFLQPSVSLTSAERRALDRGEPVVTMLDADDRELAVFAATKVGPHVTPDRTIAWMRQIEQLRKGRYVVAAGRFSSTPRLDDLAGLTLDDVDLEDIRICRPGRCGLKLSSTEITRLRQVVATSGARWKEAVQAAFREMVLARVLAFSRGGHAALDAIHDRKEPQSSAVAFARLLEHSPFLQHTAPDVAQQLAIGSAAPVPGSESLVYWAKERFDTKAVISATSVTLLQSDGTTRPDVLMIGVQVFATHYLDATLSVIALVRDERTARTYFVYVHRSDVDVLGGCWGPLARVLIETRIAREAPAILGDVSARLSRVVPH